MARKAAARPHDAKLAIVEAAMRLAAERSWRDIALADIAAAAGLGVVELYRLLPSKPAILQAFTRRIDLAALSEAVDPVERPRDRLFEILMRRFDALGPYKPALRRMAGDARKLGLDLLPAAIQLPRSMSWMLEAAHIPSAGFVGAVRAKALCFAYLAVLRTYLDDDSPDLTRTMAALDRALRRAEPFMRLSDAPGAEADAA